MGVLPHGLGESEAGEKSYTKRTLAQKTGVTGLKLRFNRLALAQGD
jgi:hypothetical protein